MKPDNRESKRDLVERLQRRSLDDIQWLNRHDSRMKHLEDEMLEFQRIVDERLRRIERYFSVLLTDEAKKIT